MQKIAFVGNMPAPYRESVHEILFDHFKEYYYVIYCSERELDREWKFSLGNYKKEFLSTVIKGSIHNNPKVIKALKRYNPDIVIITGFFPTMIYSFLWALFKRKKILLFTDGTLNSESHLSFFHHQIRKIIFPNVKAFIGPSLGAIKLYESYGISRDMFFRSCLAVNNERFSETQYCDKKYELMFSGQFIDRKMPFFFIEVAYLIKQYYGVCKVLLLGSGPLKESMLNLLRQYNIDYEYPGYICQDDLPKYYSLAKLFLFPTQNDPWGVVVNEAMAAGVPVITCTNAGAANDLVINGINGFVLPLDEYEWQNRIIELLDDPDKYGQFSKNALRSVYNYNYQSAALGIIDAIYSVF